MVEVIAMDSGCAQPLCLGSAAGTTAKTIKTESGPSSDIIINYKMSY